MAANRTPEQELEDFASGLGGGAYSPQRGSMVPPAAQGGLPFGAQPPVAAPPTPPISFQAPSAMPAAPMQRAPLMSLGGQAPSLEQMISERLQRVAQFNPQKARPRDEDAYAYALHELPKLQAIAATRSQERQLQKDYLKEVHASLKEFTGLTPEQQAQQRPVMERLLAAQAQLAGMQLAPEDVAHTLKSPDLAGAYAEILGDDYNPQERQINLQRLGAVAHDKRESVLGAIRAEKDQQVLATIQSSAPQVVAQMGGSAAKPLDIQTFLNTPEVKAYFDKSPATKRVFNAFVSDAKNAETLAGWGLKPGKVALSKMEKEAVGPELTGEVKDVLAGMKGPDGKPLTPATAAALPNGAAIIKQAKQIVFENKLDVSRQQGYNAVVAKAQAERTVPLIQVDGMKDVHVVNKDTEMPVDRLQTSLDHLQKGGGEAKFAVMQGKAYEAFAAAKEAEGVLGIYLDLSKNLTTTPGANFTQAAAMYAKTRLGIDNPGAGFEAMRGSVLRMARAMQGSSQSLSNLDARAVSGMLPSEWDGMPVALKRLELSAKMVQNMKDVQLGKMQPNKLMENIEQAKQEIAKMQGTVITDGKVRAVIPKGQSVPKGWKVVP